MTHICVGKLSIIGSDNGMSPGRRQAIFWTNTGLLLIRPLGTNFSEILIKILTFSFKKMRLKVSSAKRRPFCLGLNVLMDWCGWNHRSLMHFPVKTSNMELCCVPFLLVQTTCWAKQTSCQTSLLIRKKVKKIDSWYAYFLQNETWVW